MIKRTGEELRKRNLEQCYFNVYCITTKLNMECNKGYSESKILYTFFGCTLDGRKKYISCVLETEVEKASDWYDFFQGLKKRGMKHSIYALLPRNKELRDAYKLAFKEVEIFTSCDNAIIKMQKYNSYRNREEIYKEAKRLFLARDLAEYELNYKDFIEKYSSYPFIMDVMKEEIKGLEENYKYTMNVRRIVYAFNYIIEMKKRFGRHSLDREYKNKDEFIDDCAYAIYMSEAALHYYKEDWALVINEIYEEKKELIKPYL